MVFFLLASEMPAFSYVLKGPHILYKMKEKLGTSETLLVSGKLRLYNTGENSVGYVECSETLRYGYPESFRSDVFSDMSHQISIASFDKEITILNDKITSQKGLQFNGYKDIFLFKSVELLKHKLRRQGIGTDISSMGRFDGNLVYIVGAQYPDEATPQLMVDKNSFLPVRLLLPFGLTDTGNNFLDIRFHEWRKNGKIWYPGVIDFYTNGQLTREFVTDEEIVNPSFDENTFDIDYYMSLYSSGFSSPDADSSSDKIDEVQKTIDDFNKIYE